MSQITTHILDTSLGRPAEEVEVILEQKLSDAWQIIARGTTNSDGRIGDLLSSDRTPEIARYRLTFATAAYFQKQNKKSFYPRVTIEFEVTDASHYHVPLLISPFGYSTYRGS